MTETALCALPRRMVSRWRGAVLVFAMLGAGSGAMAAPQASFDPITFFTGVTDSTGSVSYTHLTLPTNREV